MTHLSNYRADDVAITVVPTYMDGTRRQRLTTGVRGVARAMALVLGRRVDVVQVHLSHGGSVLRKGSVLSAARLVGVRTIVHAHSFGFGGWFAQQSPSRQRLVRRLLRADRYIVLGDELAGEYAEVLHLPRRRVEVLHNPVVLVERSPSGVTPDLDGPITVVSLGRVGQRKGSYDIVAAAALLEPAVRERVRLIVAGDGEVEQAKAAARAAGVDDIVEFSGWIEPDERAELLARAQIFLLPSYQEGLPMAILEACAAGLAVIVTPVGGIPDVIHDHQNGLLVQPGRPDEIAGAITELVREPSTLTRLAEAGRHTATSFGIDAWYERLAAHWHDLAPRA